MGKSIAVIGAGPKGAALAAKACVLGELMGERAPRVTLFEKTAVAARWIGGNGYSDGDQLLCTPAERDLGFPYDSITALGNDEACTTMLAGFSWHAFLQEEERGKGLLDWIDRGRPLPSHRRFAEYLRWAVKKSGMVVEPVEVTGIEFGKGIWRVKTTGGLYDHEFDGVVITGSGEPHPHLSDVEPSITFNGADFWQRLGEVRDLVTNGESEAPIVIIGAGGIGGAVANWVLGQRYINQPILIIAESPPRKSLSDIRWL